MNYHLDNRDFVFIEVLLYFSVDIVITLPPPNLKFTFTARDIMDEVGEEQKWMLRLFRTSGNELKRLRNAKEALNARFATRCSAMEWCSVFI